MKATEDVPSCGLRADGSMGGRPTNLSWDAPFMLPPGVFGGGWGPEEDEPLSGPFTVGIGGKSSLAGDGNGFEEK